MLISHSTRPAWEFCAHCYMPVSSYIPMSSFSASLSLQLKFSWIIWIIFFDLSQCLLKPVFNSYLFQTVLQIPPGCCVISVTRLLIFLTIFVYHTFITLLFCVLRQNMQSDYWEPLWSINGYAWTFLLRIFLCYLAVSLTVTKPIYEY